MFRSRLAVISTPPSIRDTALKRRPVITPQPAEPAGVSEWFVNVRQRQSPSSEPPPAEDH
jgi:hypothetical protein